MSQHSKSSKRNNQTGTWVAIGAVILIILLLVWQGVALFTGDTDVSGGNGFTEPEFIAPVSNIISGLF